MQINLELTPLPIASLSVGSCSACRALILAGDHWGDHVAWHRKYSPVE